jgi:hypothetical protein
MRGAGAGTFRLRAPEPHKARTIGFGGGGFQLKADV